MGTVELGLEVSAYHCEPCFEKQGLLVEALVRMIPMAVVMNGQLVGDEWFCCPVCYDPKFQVRTRRAREGVLNKRKRLPPKPRKATLRVVDPET